MTWLTKDSMTFEEFCSSAGRFHGVDLLRVDTASLKMFHASEPALRHLYDHLLATGADIPAVLRGETDGAKVGATLRAAEAFLVATGPCDDVPAGSDEAMCGSPSCHYCALNRAASGTPIPPAPLAELRELANEMRDTYFGPADGGHAETMLCRWHGKLTAALDAMGAKK